MSLKRSRMYLIISISILILISILNASGLVTYTNADYFNVIRVILFILVTLNAYFYMKLYSIFYFNNRKMYIMGIIVFAFSFIMSIITIILCIKLIINSNKKEKIIT